MNPSNGHSLWKDDRRRVRVLNHLHHPVSFKVRSETPQLLAQAYIMEIAGLYEIRPAQLHGLPFAASNRLVVEQASFRFEREEIKDNNVVITYAQTYFGVPVWAARLEVTMQTNPLQVISSSSTAYANLSVQLPSPAAASRLYHYSNADLQHAVEPPEARERDEGWEGGHRLHWTRLRIYRYSESRRLPRYATTALDAIGQLRLPPTPIYIQPGRFYVVQEAACSLILPNGNTWHCLALIEIESNTILYIRQVDPITIDLQPQQSQDFEISGS